MKNRAVLIALLVIAAICFFVLLAMQPTIKYVPTIKRTVTEKIEVGKCYKLNAADKDLEKFRIKIKEVEKGTISFTYTRYKTEVVTPIRVTKKLFVNVSCED